MLKRHYDCQRTLPVSHWHQMSRPVLHRTCMARLRLKWGLMVRGTSAGVDSTISCSSRFARISYNTPYCLLLLSCHCPLVLCLERFQVAVLNPIYRMHFWPTDRASTGLFGLPQSHFPFLPQRCTTALPGVLVAPRLTNLHRYSHTPRRRLSCDGLHV